MLLDTKRLRSGAVIESDVCVIGGGAAGLTIALELDRAGVSCSILESGGLVRDEATADLYRGVSVGIPYDFADGCRSRFLGGSSNCWGGFCRPWDQDAFDHRDWVADSGWPIGRADLDSFYTRAHSVLKVPVANYRPAYWVDTAQALGSDRPAHARPRRMPLDPRNVEDIISQFSPPLKFGEVYREQLERSPHVSVYLWANVTDIECNPWSTAVEAVRVRTLSGVAVTFKAKYYVLAAGGIENPRLLLASNRQQQAGLGNRYGLVGRYFQDHPRIFSGQLQFDEAYRHNPLFDVKFHCITEDLTIAGARLSGQLRLPYEVQRRESLLDAQVWFRSLYAGEGTGETVVPALYRMSQRVKRKFSPTQGLAKDLMTLARQPIDTASYIFAHTSASRRLVKTVTMEMIVEPEPDPDSRVLLGDEVDALGMRRAVVDWRLTDTVVRTVDRTFELIARELRDKRIASVTLSPEVARNGWPADLEGTYHHMGTTRMHDSPRRGVVDRNCQLHGVGNLYVAGSSVFTTSSSNHPTMTLVALALRLSDRLVDQVRRPTSDVAVPDGQLARV